MSSPELKLAMVPEDGRFIPYQKANPSPTNGRIFVLKFQSSAQRYFFWLQAKSQHTNGDPSWFSQRDLKIGDIVDRLLQGVEVNAREEIASVSNNNNSGAGDEDAEMEDAGPEGHGPSATGGEPPASDRNEPSGSGNEGQGGQS